LRRVPTAADGIETDPAVLHRRHFGTRNPVAARPASAAVKVRGAVIFLPRYEYRSTMGDKSPKATQKKNSQKQAKSASSDNKKKQDIAAKQLTKQKAEAARKK
jgi:hypothetical protein